MKFLHTMIRVKDIDASLKFYTELLNMKVEKQKKLDDCTLYFLSYNDETPKNGYELGKGFGHFGFAVKSLDEFTEKLNSLGYEYLYEPFDLNGKGSKIAFVKDPDGYEVELIEKVVW